MGAVTEFVFTLKVALVAPAAMVTFAGTWAAGLSLERSTCAPSEGAGALRVTVPVEDWVPPATLVGSNVNELSETVGATDDCSKIMIAGFWSFSETATNLDAEMT